VGLLFLFLLWSCFDYVTAPERRVIPTGCRDELKRSQGQVDALGRLDDLDPFGAFRKMTVKAPLSGDLRHPSDSQPTAARGENRFPD
jgi:hypothetical protein